MTKQVKGKLFDTKDPFPPTEYLQTFLKSVHPSLEFLEDEFKQHFHPDGQYSNAFKQVLETGTSYGNQIMWSVLKVEPNTALRLHAHPNIEVDFVLKGILYEVAFPHQSLDSKYFDQDEVVYNDWKDPQPRVSRHEPGEMLLNKPGSIHQSFTREEGVVLLCLYSGKWNFIETDDATVLDGLQPVSSLSGAAI